MKRIVKNEEKLREVCEPIKFMTEEGVDKTQGLEVVNAIKEVMEAKPEIVALSAPQIGIKSRVFCIRFNDCIKTFINPIITKKSAPKIIRELSVSYPNKQIVIARPTEIEVKYYTDEFKYEDNKLLEKAAGIFDQQYQFLDGQVPSDLGLISDIKEDGEITDEDMPEVIDIYKQFIAIRAKAAKEEATANEEDSKLYRQLAFTESVINGRTVLVDPEADKRHAAAKKAANAAIIAQNNANKQLQKAEFKNFVNKKR